MLNQEFLLDLEAFLQEHLDDYPILYNESSMHQFDLKEMELDVYIENNRQPTFQQVLFDYINQSGLTDPQVYKKAGMDRRHFSKIRSNTDYLPKKNSLIALAFALELTLEETDSLLQSAGYSLSRSDKKDLMVEFFLKKKQYNLFDLNETLDLYGLEPLLK
ncbi:hypothetical protein [Oceanobacillus damuensis]|uniref:hypothetical protein n=1 Tax=Oceanobacillus damuensis TaxID=937928 RepID=UPI000836FEB4|nr:hypothetical protein [Oceanobacillus damuensis]